MISSQAVSELHSLEICTLKGKVQTSMKNKSYDVLIRYSAPVAVS